MKQLRSQPICLLEAADETREQGTCERALFLALVASKKIQQQILETMYQTTVRLYGRKWLYYTTWIDPIIIYASYSNSQTLVELDIVYSYYSFTLLVYNQSINPGGHVWTTCSPPYKHSTAQRNPRGSFTLLEYSSHSL
jgi:hypothetical protein